MRRGMELKGWEKRRKEGRDEKGGEEGGKKVRQR